MEIEVLDGATMEELVLDEEQRRKKVIDPVITMEARHLQVKYQQELPSFAFEIVKWNSPCFNCCQLPLQVRQNRAQREVERLKKQSEMEARQDARREAKRRKEMREMKEVQRQEHLLQTEMARLQHQMRERRCREQLGHQRYPHLWGWRVPVVWWTPSNFNNFWLIILYIRVKSLLPFYSTEKRQKLKQKLPEALSWRLSSHSNSSNRLQRTYITNKASILWVTCAISRLVPPLRVCGLLTASSRLLQSFTFACTLQRLQKHFSIWRSAVLDRRLLMEKTLALYDWKRKLRAWRAWQAVVWAEQRCREVRKVEQEQRIENRHDM